MDELEDSEYDENEDREDNEDIFEPDYEIDKKELDEDTFEPDGEQGEKETNGERFEPDYELGEKEADEDIFEPDYELDEKEVDEEFFEPDYQLGEEIDEAYENINSQSTILVYENSEMDTDYQQEYSTESQKEEMVEPDPEEYEKDPEPIYDPDEVDFIRDMEELGSDLKELHEEAGYSQSELDEYNNTAFNAEQAYQKMKENNEEKEIKEDYLEEQAAEQNGEVLTEEIKEEGDELPKEITDSEEFEYLWEEYDKLEQEGKSLEEISELMHEAEETYQMLKDFEDELEEIYEKQEKEDLDAINHKGEEDAEDVKEEIDRVDAIEHLVGAEEELYQQGISQEEIDEKIEEVGNEFFQSETEEKQHNNVSEDLRNVQSKIDEEISDVEEDNQITQISIDNNNENKEFYQKVEHREVIEEIDEELDDHEKVNLQLNQEKSIDISENEESEEYEKLQHLYRQETGKRPLYRGKETKGFSQWLEQNELKINELKEKKDKKQEEEKWKNTLKDWLKESKEEELNSELKSILKEIIHYFQEYEDLEELYKKYENGKLSEKERDKLNAIINKLQNINPIHLHLYLNISGFKAYFQDRHWWNPALIDDIKNKFLSHLCKRYETLKDQTKELSEFTQLLANRMQKIDVRDASALFKGIQVILPLLPNPCYCVRRALESREGLSLFLGLKPYYITYKSQRSQRGKQLGLDYLSKICTSLKRYFDFRKSNEVNTDISRYVKIVEKSIEYIIKNYKNSHKLKLYAHGGNGILDSHPNIKLDYFKEIDTLEKAYWLGWLFAEGYITIKKLKSGKKYYRLGVGCLQDDFILLERFARALGLDIRNNIPRIEKYTTSKGEVHALRRIRIINDRFCKNLISHGFIVGKKKSKNIRLPNLKTRELLLAFLLGYYDGDGTMGRSTITSGSIKFLEDILNSSLLNIKVFKSRYINYDSVKKKYHLIKRDKISLGSDLMREMISNYNNSLPRKRAFWENWVDKRTVPKKRPTPKLDLLNRLLPRKILLKLMSDLTLKEIAFLFGVSYDTLKKYMKTMGAKITDGAGLYNYFNKSFIKYFASLEDAKKVLTYLLGKQKDLSAVGSSIDAIARDTKINKIEVERIMKSLEKLGIVSV